jgi:hypothetical protein
MVLGNLIPYDKQLVQTSKLDTGLRLRNNNPSKSNQNAIKSI